MLTNPDSLKLLEGFEEEKRLLVLRYISDHDNQQLVFDYADFFVRRFHEENINDNLEQTLLSSAQELLGKHIEKADKEPLQIPETTSTEFKNVVTNSRLPSEGNGRRK